MSVEFVIMLYLVLQKRVGLVMVVDLLKGKQCDKPALEGAE